MSYPEKYRIRTVEYRQEGHTLVQTSKVFKVDVSTIRAWEKRLREEGSLADREIKRPFKKIDPEKLKVFMKDKPDAYLKEIAEVFSCCLTAVRKALKRLNITRKKKRRIIKNSLRKK
jgi:transposase